MRPLDQLDQSLVERLITSLRAPGPHLLLCRLRVLEALRSAAALRDDNEMALACEADVAKLQGRLGGF